MAECQHHNSTICPVSDQPFEVPAYDEIVLRPRATRYCVVVPVINEGERIRTQLLAMRPLAETVDVIIADGGSTDGSLDPDVMSERGVRAVLVKTGPGKLSAQLRMGFAFALEEGYQGVVTIDGNGKDGVDAIPLFLGALDAGFDFAQGSRFVTGGVRENTPVSRLLAIRLLHAPVVSMLAGVHYTDTTNGYRAHSAALLTSPSVAVFRHVFERYELLAHISVAAARSGLRVTELPVRRSYPPVGEVPTKLGKVRGPLDLLGVLARTARGEFDAP